MSQDIQHADFFILKSYVLANYTPMILDMDCS